MVRRGMNPRPPTRSTLTRGARVWDVQIEQAAWNQGEEYLVLDRNLSHVAARLAEGVRVVRQPNLLNPITG